MASLSSSRTSDLQTADAQIWTGKGRLNSVSIFTDGTNAASVVLYDGTSASGKVLAKLSIAGATLQSHVNFVSPVAFEVGIFADVTGTGAGYIAYWGG